MSDTPVPPAVAETLAARDQAIAALTARASAAEGEAIALRQSLQQARAETLAAQTRAIAIETEAEARLGPLTQAARRNLADAVAADRALRRAALIARDKAADLVLEARRGMAAELDRERKVGHDLAWRLERAELELEGARAELASLVAQLERAGHEHVVLSGGLDNARKATQELIVRLENVEKDRDGARAVLVREQGERRAVEVRLDKVLNSTSWKLSAPLRLIGRSLGRGA